MAAVNSTGSDHDQYPGKRHMMLPPDHANSRHTTDPGAAVHTDDDYPSFEEEELPMSPSAANIMVEETPESRRIRLEMEETKPRKKIPQIATTSSRLQVRVLQANVLEDPNFSFMPAHRQSGTTHHHNGRSRSCVPPAAQHAADEGQKPSDGARPYRYVLDSYFRNLTDSIGNPRSPERRNGSEPDPTSDQLRGETLREDEIVIDDEPSAQQRGSLIAHSEPNQHKQYDEPVTTAQGHASRSIEDQRTGEEEEYDHNGPYHGHVGSATVITGVPQVNATSPNAASPAQAALFSNEDDDHDDIVDLTHSPPSKVGMKSRPFTRLPGNTGAGRAPLHHARVTKASRRRHPNPGGHPHIHQQANRRPLQLPSEDDLILLLQARVRRHGQVQKRLDYLELQNGSLLQEKEQSGAELQRVTNARDQYAQEYNSLTQSLEVFKEKYYKLKKWALEANKDCEELQKTAASFERSLVEVTDDRNQLHAQLQDAQSTSDTASEQMANVRNEICEVKVMAEERLAKVNQLTGLVVGKDDQLKSEKLQCKKWEDHIARLEEEKKMHNLRMHNDQQELHRKVEAMSEKLQTLQTNGAGAKSDMELISASLNQIQTTVQNHLSTKTDISSLIADFGSRADSFDGMKASIGDKLEEAIVNLKNTLQKDLAEQEEKILSAAQAGNEPLSEVKKALSSLEQKAGHTGEMIKLLQETKIAAERNLKIIANNVTKALGAESEAAQAKIEALQTEIGNLRNKSETACEERDTCSQEREREKAEHQAEINRVREEGNTEGRLQGREQGILEGREQGMQKGRQERDAEKDAEHQAEVDDLLALLTEARQEHKCLQVELNKAEEYVKLAQNRSEQAQEQMGIDMAEYSHRIECKLRDLQAEIKVGHEQRAKDHGEIESLNAIRLQLHQDLEASRGETTIAIKEQDALQDEIADLERRLDWTKDTLEQAACHLREITNELKVFKEQQPAIEQLKEDFLSQKREVEAKSQEVQVLQKEAEKQELRRAQLEEEARESDRLKEENNALKTQLQTAQETGLLVSELQNELEQEKTEVGELRTALAASRQEAREKDQMAQDLATTTKRLKELEKQSSVIPEQQKRLQQKDATIAELKAALQISQQKAQEKDKLTGQITAVRKQLEELQKDSQALAYVQTNLQEKNTEVAELKAALSPAREELSKIDSLQKTNNSLKENLVSLSSDLEQLNEECAELRPLKEAVKAKDDELAELQKQLGSANGQLAELAELREELQRKEDELAAMQQQVLSLEGALSNAKLDQETRQPPPQRRVADRSGRTNVSPNAHIEHPHPGVGRDDIGLSHADTLVSSTHTTVVPETQPEIPDSVPVDHDSLIPLPDQQAENSESELSAIPSEDEDDLFEDDIDGDINHSQAYSRGQGHVSPMMRAVERLSDNQGPLPSSPYSSQGEQMLLDQVSQGHPGEPAGAIRGIVTPRNGTGSTQLPSPLRLRSGSQLRRNAGTPEPSTLGRNRASTPAIRREQHQPNSAAKRRIDPAADDTASQENTKKLKRRPENLGVRSAQPRNLAQSSEQTPAHGPASWRKSVVGTNAPTPGKSQRTPKAGRKGSRQDKYASRFAADA
ncbi:hypothetical protein H2200_002315 [Cladophialophora chaetospira]|uniref:Uncharacterized protein n=1 Tax=Cladophialophora chaetospira TaxID=386627 RepID=A0AA38XIR5_9EURO|nr:hypothetical protein H2200_002315 [Cladophialophora chaetospira]